MHGAYKTNTAHFVKSSYIDIKGRWDYRHCAQCCHSSRVYNGPRMPHRHDCCNDEGLVPELGDHDLQLQMGPLQELYHQAFVHPSFWKAIAIFNSRLVTFWRASEDVQE